MDENDQTLPQPWEDIVQNIISEVCEENEDIPEQRKKRQRLSRDDVQSGGREVGNLQNYRQPVESIFPVNEAEGSVNKGSEDNLKENSLTVAHNNAQIEGLDLPPRDEDTLHPSIQHDGPDLLDFPENYFEVSLEKTKSFKHKNQDLVNEHSYRVKLIENIFSNEDKTLEDIEKELYYMFASLMEDIRRNYQDTDLVRVFITHDEIVNTNIIVGPDYLGNMTVDVIMEKISLVISSNAFIPADSGLEINVAAVRNLRGSKYSTVTNLMNDLHTKRSIINVENEDGLCLPRAIALAVAREKHLQNPTDRKLEKIFLAMKKKKKANSTKHSIQKTTALKYMEKAMISPDSVGLLEHIPKYEDALNVSINVISARGGNKRVYTSSKVSDCNIFLYHLQSPEYTQGHFAVITKITGLLNRSYYCNKCDKGFNNKKSHKCSVWCNICGRSECLEEEKIGEKIVCGVCNAFCRSKSCLKTHSEVREKSQTSMCDKLLFCPKCYVSLHHYRTKKYPITRHTCGEAFCNNCRKMYIPEEEKHRCYMRSIPSQKQTHPKGRRFIFYDFESMLMSDNTHVPNLVIAKSVCDVCGVDDSTKCERCGSRCTLCEKWDGKNDTFINVPCSGCGDREVVFRGMDTVNLFCKWLFTRQHNNMVVIAHNARSYDNYFLYRYLIENSIVPEVIFNGCKIMYCRIGANMNIKMLDSLNFLPMALAKLPKSFGLHELKKGYFPHLYNTEVIYGVVDKMHLQTLPPKHFYDMDNMSPSKRDDFLQWYEENEMKGFNMQKELEEYCRSDVDILLKACWSFRNLYMKATGPENSIDPFDYITIASLCMGTFRSKFIPEKWDILLKKDALPGCFHRTVNCGCVWREGRKASGDAELEIKISEGSYAEPSEEIIASLFRNSDIAIIPVNGYARRDNYSNECMEWLGYMRGVLRKQLEIPDLKIQHACSSEGEKVVRYTDTAGRERTFRLDGFFLDNNGNAHAMEFNGCWYHGCPTCYPTQRTEITVQGRNLQSRYNQTLFKEKKLSELGYTLHSEWSCKFAMLKKTLTPDLLPKFTPKEHLQLRNAYTGGRTNAISLMEEFKEKHSRGGYLDFCSLYPYVLKYNRYPVGHPERIVENFLPLLERRCIRGKKCEIFDTHECILTHKYSPYFGIIMCTILPPKKLFFPVLPLRVNGKLMFPLCRECAEKERQNIGCTCEDEKRQITGTWCTPEINVALAVGYRIVSTNEVLTWADSEEIDPNTGFGGLFTGYVNMFLKMKTEASGFPREVKSEKQKDEYIQRYLEKEQVALEKERIQKNPGLRSIGKLALNSFYGKFGQRTNMKKTVFITDYSDLYKHLSDITKVVQDFHVLDENMVVLEYINNPELMESDSKTNVNIASFCTSYARLRLWRTLFRLDRRVLYHDTDSVIFTYSPWEWKPETGEFLGELTDELTCKELGCPGCLTGHWIVDFISCGPKNYAFKTNTGEVVCKVRGFSLNYNASQTINLKSMKDSLIAWKNKAEGPDLVTVKSMILRKKLTAVIYTSIMPKKYSVVYNKRVVTEDLKTIPYGF